jgi:hypothetical protein
MDHKKNLDLHQGRNVAVKEHQRPSDVKTHQKLYLSLMMKSMEDLVYHHEAIEENMLHAKRHATKAHQKLNEILEYSKKHFGGDHV